MQDREGACSHVTAQGKTCHVSIEEAKRYAPPANCWLTPPSPQEVMIGNPHPVSDTTAVAMADVASAAGACAAADMSGSHCNMQVTRYDKARLSFLFQV